MPKNRVSEALAVWSFSMLSLLLSSLIEVKGYAYSTIVTGSLLAAPPIAYMIIRREVLESMLQKIKNLQLYYTLSMALGAWVLSGGLTFIQDIVYPPPPWYLEEIRRLAPSNFNELIIALLLTWLIVAPVEELLFRWIVLRALVEAVGIRVGVIVSALIFSFSHLDPWNFISPLIVGLAAGWIIAKGGSLLSAIIIHGLHNTMVHIINMFLLS
ncbi:MAG: CPBP family intramembrane metalloprotease [Aigarchaeota archaeon]|nr:CPBP family intramembrane metalloprotease [Aigarchaeota archaeon]MCX8192516.1 CPBP family intramembrane metalloprotease [Nitrososphaeria archaeon]MDW7985748.1 CPBP family intramembrane glutamic endopeptidase [Nitrososphaerota archaeon]